MTGTGGPTLEFLPYGRHTTQVGYTPVHFLPVVPSPDCIVQQIFTIITIMTIFDYFFYTNLVGHVPTLLYIPRVYVDSVLART